MAEALVNTIKRDYVYTNDCETAEKVLKMLPYWFHDYNHYCTPFITWHDEPSGVQIN
jgi:hypothetical protein